MSYTYDVLGRLKSTTRAGSMTNLDYNQAGAKISMADPDMGAWSYTYDSLGNMKTQVDARGCTTSMTYDELYRVVDKTSSGAGCGQTTSVSFQYNSIGLRSQMTDGSGSTAWTNDTRGRMIKEIDSAFTTQWSYNSANQVTSMTYPDGETVTTAYNSLMQPESLSGSSAYIVKHFMMPGAYKSW